MLTPAANDPRVTDSKLPFVFRVAGRWDQEPAVVLERLLRAPVASKLALVSDKSAYGQALGEAMRQALAKAGSQPVADESVESGTKDFTPIAAKLKGSASGGPDTAFYAGYAQEGAALAKALRGAGLQTALALGDAARDQALIADGGDAVEGLQLAAAPDPKLVPAVTAFLEAYKKRYGTPASLYAVSTYDTVRLVQDGLRRSGGKGGEALRQELARTADFKGVYWGSMSFDQLGDLRTQTYVTWTVRGGQFEQERASG